MTVIDGLDFRDGHDLNWNMLQFVTLEQITETDDVEFVQALGDSSDMAPGPAQSPTPPSYEQNLPHQPGHPTHQSMSAPPSRELVQSDLSRTAGRDLLGSGGRDFFSNVSSELNGIAAQTSSMFSGIFGRRDVGMF